MSYKSSAINQSISFRNSQNLKIKAKLLKISRKRVVFEICDPYSVLQIDEILSEMIIIRSDKIIYNGKAVIVNMINAGIVFIVSANLSDDYQKNLSNFDSDNNIQDKINSLIQDFEIQEKINKDFKLIVVSIRSFLLSVKSCFDEIELLIENSGISGIKINSEFIIQNFKLLFEKLEKLYEEFGKIAACVEKENLFFYQRFAQKNLHSLVLSSPFPHRIYNKPLGYAGDYEMMNMIQRDNAEGSSFYAKFINVFHTNIPIANSVKNRTKLLIKMIENGVETAEKENEDFNALSIGCGPALEVSGFIKNNFPKTRCYFKLLDFNQETLNFASDNAKKSSEGKSCYIETELNSVYDLLKTGFNNKIQEKRYDFVYCAGLFDYLSDKICSQLIKMFFNIIKPKGKILVTNMHSTNKNDRYMQELIFEWSLIYRDEKIMGNLVPSLGKQRIFTDSTGVNLCLEITN